MLIVTTDRLSAFDVMLPDPIPGRGAVLSKISRFWFDRTKHIVPNHILDTPLESVVTDPAERATIADRYMIVKRLKALPIEAVVRGYIIGSGWKDYQQTGKVCGIQLPEGLRQADRLKEPLFTPATKAELGEHDENIDYDRTCRHHRPRPRRTSARHRARLVSLRRRVRAHTRHHHRRHQVRIRHRRGRPPDADRRGADADSSRFWPADTYRPGTSPPSFDKQFVRDYLETLVMGQARART